MAQAQMTPSTAAQDIGSTFDTKESPLLRYLRRLSDGWTEAKILVDSIEGLIASDKTKTRTLEGCAAAKIIDVLDDNTVHDGPGLSEAQLLEGSTRAAEVNDFIAGFSEGRDGLHTRLLILGDEDLSYRPENITQPECSAVLFFFHLLGIELDMDPSEIAYFMGKINPLLWGGDVREKSMESSRPGRYTGTFRPTNYSNTIMLGVPEIHPSFDRLDYVNPLEKITCSYRGLRTFQARSFHLVLILMPLTFKDMKEHRHTFFFGEFGMQGWNRPAFEDTAHGLRPAPRPSTIHISHNNCDTVNTQGLIDTVAWLKEIVNSGTWKTIPSELALPRAHWVGALLHINAMQCKIYLHGLWERRDMHAAQHIACFRAHSEQLELVLYSVESFCEDHANFPPEDYQPGLRELQRIAKREAAHVTIMKAYEERQRNAKTMRMTELQMNESRSAIALTFLAFIFVPISLASSIYGMNVQQINSTGHSIWAFVATSLAMLGSSVFAWLFHRSLRNWNQLYKYGQPNVYARREQGIKTKIDTVEEVVDQALRAQDIWDGRLTKLALVLGLKGLASLELRELGEIV